MYILTPSDLTKLNEARRLQVERYRTAFFKKEGKLPSDDAPEVNPQWLRVKLGALDTCIPVKTLTLWANTFDETAPLSFDLGARVTLERGTSRISLFAVPVEVNAKGQAYRPHGQWGRQFEFLPDAVLLSVKSNVVHVQMPDYSAELSTLKAETTAARKQLAKERAIAKARKAERDALDTLARHTQAAVEAQAVIDSMTPRQALARARQCLEARRLLRATLAALTDLPAWLPPSFERSSYEPDPVTGKWDDRVYQLETAPAWRELASAYEAAKQAREAYKPRLHWPSYVASLAKEAGQSLAAYKRGNPDRAFPIYGPALDKLKEAERRALDSLSSFARDCFCEYLKAQGLPDCLAGESWQVSGCRTYSRARLLLATWKQLKPDLESQAREAAAHRETLEAQPLKAA